MKKTRTQTSSMPIRITDTVYDQLVKQKDLYGKMNGLKTVTFSQFLEKVLNVADLLLNGIESYAVDGKMYDDPAEAWGAAVNAHVKTGSSYKPLIYVRVGEDKRFELGKQND